MHYHPAAPSAAEIAAGYNDEDEFEYSELQNVSAESLDFHGVQLSAAVNFSFTNRTLAPGARVLVVENVAAFAMRYGAGLPVAGQFAGSLGNNGEQLRVLAANGAAIADFAYDDAAPWPLTPDGMVPRLC